ncbi:Mn-containing catalase [Halomicrobium zhouii]|uniref:Mn-containing catalase n=1 Tax=Halomicrobium zhouii TaxID=767519 RepID=A0A1I6KPV3_9EURY|nr:manganese catalase family protein [Halomicrobium zhouii]SFR93263.1 Mn-containing catalase [Halomicrobium zhouii]
MFYHDNELQYEVEVEEPDPTFARALQQAIGGVEGEMRVANQYLFQAFAVPSDQQAYKELLLDTAAEELGHIEMLATAVKKNLRDTSVSLGDISSDDATGLASIAGMQPRQYLSGGMNPTATDANGFPFSGNYVVASGNIAADMVANVMAESTGRLLATRLYEMTDDPGMKDMLAYLVARDTMHQNQWLELLTELGDSEEPFDVLPIPDSFPDAEENEEFNYAFLSTNVEPTEDPEQPWTTGASPDGEGEFSYVRQLDLDGAPPDVGHAEAETYNDPTPRDEG